MLRCFHARVLSIIASCCETRFFSAFPEIRFGAGEKLRGRRWRIRIYFLADFSWLWVAVWWETYGEYFIFLWLSWTPTHMFRWRSSACRRRRMCWKLTEGIMANLYRESWLKITQFCNMYVHACLTISSPSHTSVMQGMRVYVATSTA